MTSSVDRISPDAVIGTFTDVDALIATFDVSGGGEARHTDELKAIAGLEPTPPPPASAREDPRLVARALAVGAPGAVTVDVGE